MTTHESPTPAPREAVFTLNRAAEVAGVSASTLRRHKDVLREHGATISENGWQVPMSALVASGLMRRTTPPDDTPAPAPRGADTPAEAQVHERVRELELQALELRHALELERERRQSAEAIAGERAEALEAERMALRMLTAGPAPTAPTTTTTTPERPPPLEQATPEPERRSWWRRTFG